MTKRLTENVNPSQNNRILGRQIALFAAFVLPVYKLLEAPSILARFTKGDLLLPAFLHYLFQTGLLIALLIAASKSEEPLLLRLERKLGKWIKVFYLLYAVFFLFYAVLPLLDVEKFVYAAFYDTSPTLFSFAAFFLFSAFLSIKGVKTLGRFADACLLLFLLPFFALLLLSLNEANATNLLPLFEQRFGHTVSALTYTSPHFSDAVLLLPLIVNLRFEKGDGKKITLGYLFGGVFTLLFLGIFYGLYSTIAPREHYAFSKIAQYFPALSVVGRIDLVFVYMLCVVLFFFTATPLQYTVSLTARSLGTQKKVLLSVLVNFAAFLFVLYCNKYYDALYAFFCKYLFPAFWIFSILPLALLFFKKEKGVKTHA